jgi:multiple sugar transport system substrate-binding protein
MSSRMIRLCLCFLLCLGVLWNAEPCVSAASESVTITIAVRSGGHATPFYETIAPFRELHPNAAIKIVELPVTEMYEKQITEMAAATGAFDIIEFCPSWKGDYWRFLLPLDDYMKQWDPDWEDIMPSIRDSYSNWEGKIYGIPEDGDVHILYYRKDALDNSDYQRQFKEKYGYELAPPDTWDEYIDIAEFFNGWDWDGDGQINYGCSEMAKRGEVFFWFLQRFGAMGGRYFDEKGNPAINSAVGVAALENLAKAIKFAPPGALNFEYTEHENAFISGQVAMNINWGSQQHVVIDPKVSKVYDKTGYALSPGVRKQDGSIYRRTCLAYGWNLGISRTCRHPEIAYQYIKFLTGKEISKKFILAPNTDTDPYRRSHFDDPDIVKADPDYYPIYEDALEIGYPQLSIPRAAVYMDMLDIEISNHLAGKKGAQQALDDAAREWKRLGTPPFYPIP